MTRIKPMPWIAVSLLLATSVFSQSETADFEGNPESSICQEDATARTPSGSPSCQPPQPTCQPYVCKPAKCGNIQEPQTPPIGAYNAPAEIHIGIAGEWNFFSSISFLYLQAKQDNMQIAREGSTPVAGLFNPGSYDSGKWIDMNADYKPAFKLCMGMNFRNDDWIGYIEYTRYHGKNSKNIDVPSSNPTLYNLWGTDAIASNLTGTAVFSSLRSNFHTNFDVIDGLMERIYFVGQRLIFHSSFGLRFGWISESLNANYTYNGSLIQNSQAKVFALPSAFNAVARSDSWGIGPRMGLEMDWLLRKGVRIFSSCFADVLYTSYEVQTKSSTLPFVSALGFAAGNAITATNRDDSLGLLRTHLDFELGAGWGRYFDYNNWHFDLTAAYGFQVFFNQNMLNIPTYSPGNLYLQGVTFTARLDY